jgi:hypothetical protein
VFFYTRDHALAEGFQTRNPKLGKPWESRNRRWGYILAYFKSILYILGPFGIFCGNLCIFPRFGMLYEEKYGNPALAAWRSGHRVRLKNRRSRARIPPG